MTDPTLAAAVDLGTNTGLLLVARRGPDQELDVVEDDCVTCRLGEGLATTGELQEEAIERTLTVLSGFRNRMDSLGVAADRRRVVGTAVLRRASNARRFLDAARERLGIEVDVLSEEEEARVGYAAVVGEGADLDTLVVDVGGGSTELAWDRGSARLSQPIGALVLTEAFREDPRGFAAIEERVAEACGAFPADLARVEPRPEVVLIGGTPGNLACLELGLPAFDAAAAEGTRVPGEAARRWARELAALGVDERRALPIEADRAEILPAGLACLAGVLERIGAPEARITGRGLRYGIVHGLLEG